jgi:hypothetical protein
MLVFQLLHTSSVIKFLKFVNEVVVHFFSINIAIGGVVIVL